MNDTSAVPKWFWSVAVIALLWNLMGLAAFIMQVTMTDEVLAQLPVAEQELYANLPSWVNIAFGVAVMAGTVAAIGLILRKTWAFPMFVISLLGIIAQQSYMYFMSNVIEVMGAGSMVLPMLVLLLAIFFAWFSHSSSQKAWLT